ncbi:MAG: MotA/TolQ/ExbB proton channel family protein [Xanthomonadales bacterium]|nr:MotA/TolQ/ExbB proton channel family protein [Xanthomonadales bacterium]
MKKSFPVEFVFQLFALLLSVLIVHTAYVTVVRPAANQVMEEQAAALEADPNYVPERSVFVLIRDFEQEACFILLLWALAIMAFKSYRTVGERNLLDRQLVPVGEGISILPEDTREYSRPLQALPDKERGFLLPRVLLSALHRFRSTRDIQSVATTVREMCEAESERLESELSMVRYIAWAIPSIGFIGTVRGIGQALSQAHKAVEGDISGVTENLGVAFNSTFIALVLSIVLMFLMQQLQLMQERLVLDSQEYSDEHLISKLREE